MEDIRCEKCTTVVYQLQSGSKKRKDSVALCKKCFTALNLQVKLSTISGKKDRDPFDLFNNSFFSK